MIVYVIFDPIHERVREVYSDINVAYERCEELDKLWGNDYVYPHVAYKIEVDKEYPKDHYHDGADRED